MKKSAKELTKIIKNRITFYTKVSENNGVFMEKFEALVHNKTKDRVFLHLKYELSENGKTTAHEEIETFTDDGGWMCLFTQKDMEKLNHFLSDTTQSEIDCTNVKIKKNERQEKIS